MTHFTGTLTLVRLALRRDRLRIPVWVLALAGIIYASAVAVPGVYKTQQAIDAYAALVGTTPMTVAFAGPALGLNTVQGIIIYEISFTAIVGVVLMAMTMTTRHTRAEEESGRTELVRAAVVGRHAAGAAALLTTALACLLLGGLLWLGLVTTPLSAASAAVFSLSITALGLVFSGVALCLAQVFVHGRTATGAALAVFAATYVLRAAGDVREDWLVWTSPVGWVQAAHVPTENHWWPLLLPVGATALLLLLAVRLADLRDFGGGLLPSRAGRARAPRSLAGPLGLTLRTQRGAVLGWCVGVAALGLLTGALGSSMQDLVESNPTMAEYLALTEGGSVLDAYLATMVLILALVAGAFAIWSATHPGAAETEGQLELVLASPVSRWRAMLDHLLATVVNTTLVLLAAALGVGVAHGLVTSDVGEGWRAVSAQLAYLPALLVLIGLVVLVAGWRPGWTWVGWVVLAFAFVIGWLGGLLQPPDWVTDLSVFSYVPRVPVESAAVVELPVLAVVGALLAALGVVGFRLRDLRSTR